jgi:hypothetical protein
MSRTAVTLLVIALLLGAALPAHAQPMFVRRLANAYLPGKAFYLKPGLSLGGAWTHEGRTGFLLGGEVSALYWYEGWSGGVVAEAVYDWERRGARAMFGPLFGAGPFGIEGGYLVDFAGAQAHHGGAVRVFFSVGVAALFVRYGALHNAPDFVDFGLLLKLPLPVWQRRYPWPRCC